MLLGAQNFLGIGLRNHGRPWACEREEPVVKKVSWKVGVYSHLSGCLIGHRRDSAARRVVSETYTQKVPHQYLFKTLFYSQNASRKGRDVKDNIIAFNLARSLLQCNGILVLHTVGYSQ